MDMDIDENASDDDSEHDLFRNLDDYVSRDSYSGVPVILPRQRFAGARNIATIKDGEHRLPYPVRFDPLSRNFSQLPWPK
jgi:hypothetical protein